MSDCCKPMAADACCCGGSDRVVMLFPCSGSANVGEIADHAARELTKAAKGMMACLAGLGGDVQGMIQGAKDADLNVVIDGCPVDCASKTLDRAGVTNYRRVRVTDLGIEKQKDVPCPQEQVDLVAAKVAEIIGNGRTTAAPCCGGGKETHA